MGVHSPPSAPAESSLREAPNAGVIEDARTRQRRQWGMAATVLAAAIAAIVLGFSGRGGASTGAGGSRAAGRQPVAGKPPSSPVLAACVSDLHPETGASQGSPSRALLSMLAALRCPTRHTDAPPAAVIRGAPALVFVRYIRRARVAFGQTYYLAPALVARCEPHKPSYRIMLVTVSGKGWSRGGGPSAMQIREGTSPVSAQSPAPVPGKRDQSEARSIVEWVVPDRVASVTLRYVAEPANRYHGALPAFTVTIRPVNNVVLADVPRTAGSGAIRNVTMTWRASSGQIIKTISTP